jgi:hypothetical protein
MKMAALCGHFFWVRKGKVKSFNAERAEGAEKNRGKTEEKQFKYSAHVEISQTSFRFLVLPSSVALCVLCALCVEAFELVPT